MKYPKEPVVISSALLAITFLTIGVVLYAGSQHKIEAPGLPYKIEKAPSKKTPEIIAYKRKITDSKVFQCEEYHFDLSKDTEYYSKGPIVETNLNENTWILTAYIQNKGEFKLKHTGGAAPIYSNGDGDHYGNSTIEIELENEYFEDVDFINYTERNEPKFSSPSSTYSCEEFIAI